ncbi:MAG TPA: diguanylate cyclase, partial [Terriglobia bacterium]|nr:diguanylate cyclase [Terriglobia bacterium]
MEIRIDDGTVIILDCGTGARELGNELLKEGIRRIHLLIGHTHWDHIHGFPFFTPASLAQNELNIFAPVGFQRSLEDALSGQMQYSYFPVKLQDLSSRIHFTELEEGLFRIGDVLVETQYLNHTAPTIAYRISYGGSTVAYVTDHEPYWNNPGSIFQHPGDQRHVEFLKDADLVIHDAQYSEEEYRTKRGWGHSTVEYATDVAMAAGARRLALFHHDPTHDDDTVLAFEQHARARAKAAGSSIEVFAAAEGLTVELSGAVSERASAEESALERRPIRGGRVLVVTGNPSDFTDVERTLSEDALVINGVSDGQTAIERAAELQPDLIILGSMLSDGEGVDFIQPIRSVLKKPHLPILIFTEDSDSQDNLHSAGQIGTDYLALPFSPPMLRSRVRSWLARTMGSDLENANADSELNQQRITSSGSGVSSSQTLASVELLRSLTPAQLAKLLSGSLTRWYPIGYAIIRPGERGQNVYVVLSGRVRVAETLPDNSTDTYVAELRQGEVFGELDVLKERTRSVTVVALEKTECLMIPDVDFLEALRSSPETMMGMVRLMDRRLIEADRSLALYAPDRLTGLPGRRAFHELYKRVSAGPRRRGNSVLLIAVDVLHLKTINDRHGYNIGDEVLRAVADVLVDASRETDLVARYGPDEFAAFLVEAGAEHADIVVRRIQQ